MTEKPETAEGTKEPVAPPAPEVSQISEVETSRPEVDTDAIAKRTAEIVLAEIRDSAISEASAKMQGAWDATTARLQKMANYLKASQGDAQKAAREMALDEIIAERERGSQRGVPGRTDRSDNDELTERMQAKTVEVLMDEGIPPDDPQVAELAKVKVSGPAEWELKLRRLAAQRRKTAEPGKASAVVQETGRPPAAPEDEEAIAAELAALQAEGFAKGTLTKPENIQKRAELKAKLAALRK